jgi:pyruvate,water dikinase
LAPLHITEYNSKDPYQDEDEHCRQGTGCCPGTVSGRVRFITEADNFMHQPGEILISQRGDANVLMMFPTASGFIFERGSLLSHAAIVSRELKIPTVMNVNGITQWLQEGDWIEIDGQTGLVKRHQDVHERRF